MNCTSPSRYVKHGFTLIELLVVIAIISLLVSILLPSLNTARELARSALCMSNTRTLMLAQTLYAQDYGCYAGYTSTGTPPISYIDMEYIGLSVFDRYTPSEGSPINLPPYVCPNLPQAIKTASYGGYTGISQPYGWNAQLGSYGYGGTSPLWEFLSPEQVTCPANVLGWADTAANAGIVFTRTLAEAWGSSAYIVLRHGKDNASLSNASFIDGHCSTLNEDDIYNTDIYNPQN